MADAWAGDLQERLHSRRHEPFTSLARDGSDPVLLCADLHGGGILAVLFVIEIGDISRFPRAQALTCWAGLTPRHNESDRTVRRGQINNAELSAVS
jgi:transposase